MGTFGGHALPGSFFIGFALWALYWMLKSFYRRRSYDLQKTTVHVPKYQNRVSFPLEIKNCGCCSNRSIPIDSYLKSIACLIGITGEVITGFNEDWVFEHVGNVQHSTMFSMFALSGIIELFRFYGILKLPLFTEYLFNLIALLSEFFLFTFHLHQRSTLDVYLHLLLAGMIPLAIVFGVAEILVPNQPIFGIMRNWTFLMQGTWFWQIGAILYPPFAWMPIWDHNARESIPRAANLFVYHMLANFSGIVLLTIYLNAKEGFQDSTCVANRLNIISKSQLHERCINQGESGADGQDEMELWNRSNHTDNLDTEPLMANQ